MDKGALRICDRAFDRVKLLRKIDTLPTAFNHRDHGCQMAACPFQAADDGGMGLMLHEAAPIPWGRMLATEFDGLLVSQWLKQTLASGLARNGGAK